MIVKMAKKGMTPSQIGVMLRDNQGIAQVSTVTNSKILRILRGQGLRAVLAGGSLLLDQEGCERAQALGAQPQGHGLQVPLDSHRIPHPPLGSLLQARQEA